MQLSDDGRASGRGTPLRCPATATSSGTSEQMEFELYIPEEITERSRRL